MKNSVSDRNLFIESEEDDDVDEEEEHKAQPSRAADDDDSDCSDSSSSPDDDDDDDGPPRSRPNSYSTNWPQSYRQSIDMYSSVTPPTIGFLGTPTLSRLSSSFLSSSFRGKHTPEIIASLIKPLLPTTAADLQLQDEERQSSHSLLIPPLPSRKPSLEKIQEKVSHELPVSRSCSYGQAVLNGMNVLCGVGILSTPYAVKEGGWLGLSILLTFAVLAWYTGILLRYCLDSEEGLETYPDIGQAAFGTTGRFAISIILYMELYACCVEYIILERDNLSSLFPNAQLNIGGIHLDSRLLFAILTTILVLPTTWLRDLSVLSYISGIPIAIGIYGYCYSGHAVFPNIYSSLKKPNQYPSVLFTSFAICTVMFAGVAVMGYTMFGESTQSQFTLNMPHNLVASRVTVWTTVVNPITKYALTLTPLALSLEELIPSNQSKSHLYAIMIRTTLVLSTLLVALSVPFFGLVMAFIGSLLTMLVTLIFPCACFLSILRHKVTRIQGLFCIIIITIGVVSSIVGTVSSISKIVDKLSQ
ncbi:amino acid transporter AVT1C-like isoform X2 [Musa acuminata AAA Group]|uniref:amino acid transporter AVT1C-like isoform X2 n=1 Tax=Musa acuminata AAA Group TaxID=214697 RepID=UPI0031E27F30